MSIQIPKKSPKKRPVPKIAHRKISIKIIFGFLFILDNYKLFFNIIRIKSVV